MSNYSIPLPFTPSQVRPPIEKPLYPQADLVLRHYLMRSPSGFREVEFHCNRAAIAPLVRKGWRILDVRDGERGAEG